jgi:hypothetical protein
LGREFIGDRSAMIAKSIIFMKKISHAHQENYSGH